MNQENPFLTPQVAEATIAVTPGNLADYSDAQIKKLYYRSCNVTGVGVILLLGALLLSGMLIAASGSGTALELSIPLIIGIIAFNILAAIGAFMRQTWGRVVGIIACVLMLLNLNPISIIIGIMGLFAFIGAKELFGPNRVTHKEAKAAFNAVKAKNKRR